MNSNSRIAEEAQLLTEEKWLVEALKNIRTQRNCLQIERLQLESLLSLNKCNQNQAKDSSNAIANVAHSTVSTEASTQNEKNIVELMSTTNTVNMVNSMYNEHENQQFNTFDEGCNFEELNLSITNSVFGMQKLNNGDLDSGESENEAEEMEIDMNMFMNS